MTNDSNNDEDGLFRQAMKTLGVEKSHNMSANGITHAKKPPTVSKPQYIQGKSNSNWPVIQHKDLETEAYTSELSPQLTAQSVQFHRGGLSSKNIKRLQRGQYRIQSTLDLHGLTIDETINVLNQYINDYEVDTQSCVLIIHGKGYHSKKGAPKLKSLTHRWLKAHPRTIAFCSAQPKDGGTGAIYVLLKK